MLKLVEQSSINVRPIEWGQLPKRYLNPGELEVIAALVASVNPETVIEIGCNEGRTARAVLDNVAGIETYIGVDVPPGYVFEKRVQAKEVPAEPGKWALDDPRFVLMLRKRGSFDLSEMEMPACDAVFIDGDHSRAAVEHDTAMARQIVRPGGIIIWHDYHDLGTVDVRDVLDEMHDAGSPIQHVADTWIAFERIPKE